MIIQKNNCVNCFEPITNPICTNCHTKEVYFWLKDKEINSVAIAVLLNKIHKYLNKKQIIDNDKCIVCHKNNLTICSYCFFLKVSKILLEMNFPDELVKEFLNTFNYRIGHSEYEII